MRCADDVIEDDFTSTPDTRIWDFRPIKKDAAPCGRRPACFTKRTTLSRRATSYPTGPIYAAGNLDYSTFLLFLREPV